MPKESNFIFIVDKYADVFDKPSNKDVLKQTIIAIGYDELLNIPKIFINADNVLAKIGKDKSANLINDIFDITNKYLTKGETCEINLQK